MMFAKGKISDVARDIEKYFRFTDQLFLKSGKRTNFYNNKQNLKDDKYEKRNILLIIVRLMLIKDRARCR